MRASDSEKAHFDSLVPGAGNKDWPLWRVDVLDGLDWCIMLRDLLCLVWVCLYIEHPRCMIRASPKHLASVLCSKAGQRYGPPMSNADSCAGRAAEWGLR